MINSPDPSVYRKRERQAIDHIERLLKDERLRIDTSEGRRSAVSLLRDVTHEDRQIDLKRMMAEMGVFDRLLESKMPVGKRLGVTLLRNRLFFLAKTLARVEVACLSPWRELLAGQTPSPVGRSELEAALSKMKGDDRVPTTLVLVCTSGLEPEARKLAERTVRRTVVLVEPNEMGGWKVTAPAEVPSLALLMDPELEADKRRRIREEVQRNQADLLGGGVSAERIATATQLPVELVEDELESYARDSGLQARRLSGQVVLYREGSSAAMAGSPGGSAMPFIERLKALFTGKADNQTKIRLLSERRATLGMQRDKSYEEMSVLEKKEADLREQFKLTTSNITRRRITSQLVQLRKDLDRRQQLLGMLNQQINIVSTHLHNIEMVQQGQTAQLPSSEELADDAAKAEEVLAELQASSELAGSMATAGPGGLSEEEQALYQELEREAAAEEAPQPAENKSAVAPKAVAEKRIVEPQRDEAPVIEPQRQKRPGQAEPG